jgi:hypothetical protein
MGGRNQVRFRTQFSLYSPAADRLRLAAVRSLAFLLAACWSASRWASLRAQNVFTHHSQQKMPLHGRPQLWHRWLGLSENFSMSMA